jgi:MSHA pilin protein MshA
MRNQKGFTLIELIIVIVVLGILAVTAAPQFIDFSSDARTSTVKGLKGSLQAASQTVYGKSSIQGQLADDYLDVNGNGSDNSLNGPDISTANGYPDATATGIVKAASLGTEGDDWDWFVDSGTIYIGPADFIDDQGSSDNFTLTADTSGDGTNDSGCYVSYTDAESVSQPPQVVVDTSGCGN